MKSAFNQIPLHFRDRHKTPFSTSDGDKYEFNRLCFGLKNSPKAFQSIAQEVADHLSRCINNITIALPESKDLIKMQHEDPVLSLIIQKIDQNDVSPHKLATTLLMWKNMARDIRLSYTYEKNSDTPQNKYEYVEKLLPSLEQIFHKVLKGGSEYESDKATSL
ncbi:hypothetical protein TNCV_2814361 [Trichonephila clavipes]|nr:hypothetical protein TNCV_2814361 [Trichonephila clavipes]